MTRHGMAPLVEPSPGGGRNVWSLAQVWGVYLSQFLHRTYRADPLSMAGLLADLVSMTDEQLDATIRSGRSHILVVGSVVGPTLYTAADATATVDRLREDLGRVVAGVEVLAIGVLPLWDDLQALARAALAEGSSAEAEVADDAAE
jgi:hypothetical protein